MIETIRCEKCGADSGVEKSDSIGADAARIQRIGWVPKLPILVGISKWFIACSEVCMKSLLDAAYDEHGVTDEDKVKAKEITDDIKSRIPQMAQEAVEAVERLKKALRR